jgi:transcriptional regulator with GAF, ATPase, and Fis domain
MVLNGRGIYFGFPGDLDRVDDRGALVMMQDMAYSGDSEPARFGLKQLMAAYERNLIVTALAASGWNQRRAAGTLGVLPTTLLEKMRRLGIKNPRRA